MIKHDAHLHVARNKNLANDGKNLVNDGKDLANDLANDDFVRTHENNFSKLKDDS